MERGQKIWIWRDREGVIETTIKSIGRKYIRTEYDDRIKFDVNTFREINGYGYAMYLILDLGEYKKNVYYRQLARKLEKVIWDKVDREKLDKISNILGIEEGENKCVI